MNTDFIYWTFTAAAQCVSTFVALLLTGYALVLSQIEAARDRDDSLAEIHTGLRLTYHTRLTVLAWLTAIAVVLSLLVVWVNRANVPPPDTLMAGHHHRPGQVPERSRARAGATATPRCAAPQHPVHRFFPGLSQAGKDPARPRRPARPGARRG